MNVCMCGVVEGLGIERENVSDYYSKSYFADRLLRISL